ncbi:hypothetical protein FA15DRAFT_659288 [Coprinopsis marcescibilis]|uniref:Uncharacterized protein n=1 Tax=Coprinopsis marcescibilis TaxID=230819 RepID=A0A5C3KW80_COPMA|nr:hypothetical protein FA15DRAFT_659288 [Coprinopsis marcescibilis]
MPPRNPNVPPTDSRSQLNTGSFAMGSNEQSSSRNPPLQGPSTSTTWYYPPGAPAPTNTKSAHSASVATSSAPMIGPTSSFYNAQTSTQDQSDAFAQQYQQWIDAFEGQQQRPAPFVNEAQQSPYQYASQYPSGHGSSQYATSSAGTVTQANVAPANFGDATGFSTTGFYNDFLTGGSTDRLIPAPQPSAAHRQYRSGSTPESTHQSFTNTPEPHYHQQPSQGQPHTAQRQTQPPLQTARQVTQPQPRAPMAAGPAQYVQQQYSQDNNLGYLSNSAASSTQSSSHSPSWSEENQQRYSTNPNSNNPSVSSSNISFKIHTPASKGQPVGGPPTVKSSVGSGTRIFSAATTASRGTAGVTKTVGKRKRFKKSASDDWSGDRYEGSDTESDDEDEFEGGISVGVGGFGVSSKGKGKDKPLRPHPLAHSTVGIVLMLVANLGAAVLPFYMFENCY